MSKREHAESSPPAVWAAFANASRWKSWALVVLFALNFLLLLVAMRMAKLDPDVVAVSENGKSTYVPRALAGGRLVRFIESEKQKPSDLTTLKFTQDFIELFFAVNSSTIESAFERSRTMMDAHLSEAVAAEFKAAHVIETYRLAQIRSEVTIDRVLVLQDTGTLIHLSAKFSRKRSSLLDGSKPTLDNFELELVERVVPRTEVLPDGLEIAEMSIKRADGLSVRPSEATQAATETPSNVAEAPHAR
jgi:hypothetical protein